MDIKRKGAINFSFIKIYWTSSPFELTWNFCVPIFNKMVVSHEVKRIAKVINFPIKINVRFWIFVLVVSISTGNRCWVSAETESRIKITGFPVLKYSEAAWKGKESGWRQSFGHSTAVCIRMGKSNLFFPKNFRKKKMATGKIRARNRNMDFFIAGFNQKKG